MTWLFISYGGGNFAPCRRRCPSEGQSCFHLRDRTGQILTGGPPGLSGADEPHPEPQSPQSPELCQLWPGSTSHAEGTNPRRVQIGSYRSARDPVRIGLAKVVTPSMCNLRILLQWTNIRFIHVRTGSLAPNQGVVEAGPKIVRLVTLRAN
jgi:hypothetical protein